MKKIFGVSAVLAALLMMSFNCHAGDYFVPANSINPRFRLEPTALTFWGSNITSATGYSVLQATIQDVPYDTIKAWYATMLVAKVVGWEIRLTYDDEASPPIGKIIRLQPMFTP